MIGFIPDFYKKLLKTKKSENRYLFKKILRIFYILEETFQKASCEGHFYGVLPFQN